MKVTRDEVEKFLNHYADQALDSISQDPRPLSKWVADFSKSLAKIAVEEAEDDEDDEDAEDSVFGDDDESGNLFDDPEDD